ncbi:29113_t:CDS:2, partial [Gigaspora margarita]
LNKEFNESSDNLLDDPNPNSSMQKIKPKKTHYFHCRKAKSWKLGRLNHVAIAVPDLKKASDFYKNILEHGVYTVFVNLDNTKIELLHPYGDKSPIQNFLDKNKNGGIHHVCIEVDDVKTAIKDITSKGIRVLDPEPKIGAHGNPVVFLHPKDCCGVLVELEEVNKS